MKKTNFKATAAGLILFTSIISHVATAGLIDRGNGMIYDTVQDITWLQDANYAQTSGHDADGRMHWQQAMDWVEQLSYGGYDDWRLYDADPSDRNCSILSRDGERYGYGCSGSELGHLFYNEFNLEVGQFISAAEGDAEYELFLNVQPSVYWSRTKQVSAGGHLVYDFDVNRGYTWATNLGATYHAWALRDGDVDVPEPSTLAIYALGLMGLASRRFKKS